MVEGGVSIKVLGVNVFDGVLIFLQGESPLFFRL